MMLKFDMTCTGGRIFQTGKNFVPTGHKVRRKKYVEIFDKTAISNYCSSCLAGTCSGEYCVGKEPVSEIDKKYQELLETLSPEQEEVITEYCNAIFSSGADTEEFFYRLGLKDGLNLKNTVKSVLEMIS